VLNMDPWIILLALHIRGSRTLDDLLSTKPDVETSRSTAQGDRETGH
jgi:hypothetical protein